MTDLQVNLVSWNRFNTNNFVVVPELLGLAHEFQFEKGQIRIELPTADKITYDMTGDSPLHVLSHKNEYGRKIPLIIVVDNVDVLVRLNQSVSIPEEVLTRHPNPIDLLSNRQQSQLNELAKTHSDIGHKAFELWIRVLRWKSDNGSIGRPYIHGSESGWGTYLLDDNTRHRFWAFHPLLTLKGFKTVTLVEWQEIEKTLKLGQDSPVYVNLMFDGIEHFRLGDIQRSVVDLAVACEAFIRERVIKSLPDGLTDSLMKYIEGASIQKAQDQFFEETLNLEQMKLLKRINSRLHELFKARNTILHSGHKEDLTSDECQRYIKATKKLIRIG